MPGLFDEYKLRWCGAVVLSIEEVSQDLNTGQDEICSPHLFCIRMFNRAPRGMGRRETKFYQFMRIFTNCLLTAMLATVMLSVPLAAEAEYASIDGLGYNLYDDGHTAEVVSGESVQGVCVIPATVSWKGADYTVTSIKDAFAYNTGITSVEIPATVGEIFGNAFLCASSLTAIKVYPENAVYASFDGTLYDKTKRQLYIVPEGKRTLILPVEAENIDRLLNEYYVGLSEIKVEEGNSSFASFDGVLYNKDLTEYVCCPALKTSVACPETVTTFPSGAFIGCELLESISIPASVTEIQMPFANGCFGLKEIIVDNNNQKYASFEGMLYDKAMTKLIRCPGGKESVKLAEGVKIIGDEAFELCQNLMELVLPSSIEEIGDAAFFLSDKLVKLSCHATVPPAITRYTFDNFPQAECTLHVLPGCGQAYRDAVGWKDFGAIIEDLVGVEVVTADGAATSEASAYYNALGVESATPWNGLNIVRYADGTTRKVFF